MKYIWKDVYLAGVMGILVPGLLLNVGVKVNEEAERNQIVTEAVMMTTEPMDISDSGISIRFIGKEADREMDLEEYLVGVVLAEMPASFEEEALKSQAVVARTYAIRAKEGKGKHDDGDICGDSACCQGYLAPIAYGGTAEALSKVRNAVESTAGQVLTYEGKLIEATYFSCSGGTTEDAVAVWGRDVAYLKSVPSPGEEDATYFTDQKTFTSEEFQAALGIRLKGTPSTWFSDVSYTAGGGVDHMTIGGVSYRGTTLRTLLGLRSTAFSVSVRNGWILIETSGYGHRVGMSQYGANARAKEGDTYDRILTYYYYGVDVVQYFEVAI